MKNLFHKGLYKEGLRRGRVLGIVFTCMFTLYAIFFPVNQILSGMRYSAPGDAVYEIDNVLFNPLYMLVFAAFVPFLCLSVFSFLNKRSTSDFYHSLPHKRQTIYFSYGLAVFSWVLFSIAVSALIEMMICFFGAQYITIDFGSVALFILHVIAAGILVMGGTLFSMSVTGTWFTNIVTALLILFMPRLLISCVTNTVEGLTNVVNSYYFPFFVNDDTNLVYAFVKNLLLFRDINALEISVPAILYTVGVGAVYLVLGGIMFVRRKSESAGSPALNSVVQTAIRASLSFLVCMGSCIMIVQGVENMIWVVASYCAALLVYFVYEVISTRKISGLKSALPGLAVVFALNLLFIGGVQLSKNAILTVDWQGEQISGVRIIQQDPKYSFLSYEDLKMNEIALENDSINAFFASVLRENQDSILKNRSVLFADYNSYTQVMAEIKETGGKRYYRRLWMKNKQCNALQALLAESAEMKDVSVNLPENPTTISINLSWNPTAAQRNEIYESLREEVKKIGWRGWGSFYSSLLAGAATESGISTSDELFYFAEITGTYNGQNYYSGYRISFQTPKTMKLLIDLMNAESEDSFAAAVKNIGVQENDGSENWMQIGVYSASGNQGHWSGTVDAASKVERFQEMLDKTVMKHANGTLDFSNPAYYLTLSYNYYSNDEVKYSSRLLPVTAEIKEYIGEFM